MTKLKNSNSDKTQKLKLGKTQKLKLGKTQNSNCEKIQKLKVCLNSKTQIRTTF